jgi:hypothetical protein
LNPAVFGERESLQFFGEILHHIIAFKFAVNQHIEADLFLEADGFLDFCFDGGLVLRFIDFIFLQTAAQAANLDSLGKRTNGGSGQQGQVIFPFLDRFTYRER